jgi:hypothetical protein
MTSEEYKSLRMIYQPLLEPVAGSGALVPSDDDANSAQAHSHDQIEGLLERRRTLTPLQNGEEVLAKWPDDRLYHACVVVEVLKGELRGKYRVQERRSSSKVAVVNREDIVNAEQAFEKYNSKCARVSFCSSKV